MIYDALCLAANLVCDAKFVTSGVYKATVAGYESKELLNQAKDAILNAGWNGVEIVYRGSDAYIYIASSAAASDTLAQTANDDQTKSCAKQHMLCPA